TSVKPQRVQAAIKLHWTVLTDVSFETLTIIAYLFDDVVGPLVVDAQILAHTRRHPQDTLHCRIRAVEHLVYVFRRNAILFGFYHDVQDPPHQVVPLVVALTHHRAQRFLGQRFGQDDVVIWIV